MVLNVNKGHNEELMKTCESMRGYMELNNAVRCFLQENEAIDKAVADGIDYCIKEGILVDFLKQYKEEVVSFMIRAYTVEDFKRDMYEELEEQQELLDERKMQIEEQKELLEEQKKIIAEKDRKIAELMKQLEAKQ